MKTYWDHSEKERSELTSEQVESLLKYELMSNGVLKPEQPVYLPESSPDLPTSTYYVIKRSYRDSDLLFATAEDAAKAMQLSVGWKDSTYFGGKSVYHLKTDDREIGTVDLVKEADVAAHRSALEQAAANKKSNDAARTAFQAELKACEEVTSRVWEDWNDQRAVSRRYQKVIATFNEYRDMADGDPDIAYSFLCKAFSADECQRAGEWCRDEFLATGPCMVAAEAPAILAEPALSEAF